MSDFAKGTNVPINDSISRQAAIEAIDSEIGCTNPEYFKSNEKFIKFMDDADIASFRKREWMNGFNTAVVAVIKRLKKLPSAQPEDWMEKNKDKILQAGKEGREIEFRIGGRLFAIREKAQ